MQICIINSVNKVMDDNIKNRIIKFLAYLEIGQGKFEKNCGISNGTVNNIKDGVSSPNISKIVKRYPELNLEWLITGNGTMLKSDDSANTDSFKDKYYEQVERSNELFKENRELRIQIEAYKEEIEKLKKGDLGVLTVVK